MIITLKALSDYCLQKKGTLADYPFGDGVLVFKVMGKMFALMNETETPLRINLKCDPDLSSTLRYQYSAVQPGYHMNKEHWNTVTIDGSIPTNEIWGMIDHSYSLVVKGLKKADQLKLKNL